MLIPEARAGLDRMSQPPRRPVSTEYPRRGRGVAAIHQRNIHVAAPAPPRPPPNHAAGERCQIISEILDGRTSKLISNAQISDYVLSNDLVSMALAMIAEDRTVNNLLKILMTSEGSESARDRPAVGLEIRRNLAHVSRSPKKTYLDGGLPHRSEFYIRRASDLVDLSQKRSFYDVMRAGRVCTRGPELVLGYRKRGEDPVLNPPNKHEKVRWSRSACFIVLAEN